MLRQLTIHDYAIVDSLDIGLQAGMTVITGETGAGKSIMLDALALALGDRGDKDTVRAGAENADISALFDVHSNARALAWLREHDYPDDGGDCLLRRVITREGRSRAYINGRPAGVAELRELGGMLIDIHSQHEHQSLLKTATHQRLLDEFGALQPLADAVRRQALRWRALGQELQDLRQRAQESDAQLQLLRYQVNELDELALGEQELGELTREQEALSHAEASISLLQQVLDLCRDNDEHNLLQGLSQAQARLGEVKAEGRALEEALSLLASAAIQVEEAAGELARLLDRLDPNPERLAEVDERLGLIHQVARKHRVPPAELYALQQELRARLQGMAGSEAAADTLEQELQALRLAWEKDAKALATARKKSAARLEKDINAQLSRLGMGGARFSLALNSQPGEPRPNGFESVEFLVSTNPGQPPKALARIASGGELSRISLAIQVVTARTSAIPTLVFDEVDVGIGGGVAKAVGDLLRQLGEQGQVLCVTHQPQVASQGHQHLFVSKASAGERTQTRIRVLNPEERIEEVARMLGGDELSEQSVAHAREMMS